jgi:hypothetical protein
MKILNDLVAYMNKEESRHLKLYLNRTNASGDRKDAVLFDYIRKSGENYDEEKIVGKLYGGKDKNAFYRLKNRLKEDINKSLTLQYFNNEEGNTVFHNLTLSRHFQHKRKYDLAFHYLQRAEKKAVSIHSYELLDIIYSDYIRLSQETVTVNPEEYILKRKDNREQLNRLQEIDDILAALIYRIKVSQNFSKKEYRIIDLLQKTVNDFSSNPKLKESPVLRFKIYHAVSRILLQQHNFVALEEYLLRTLKEFEEEGLFDKNNHDTKLQMLTYLVNSLYKNNKIQESLEYVEQLQKALHEFDGILHDKYLFYYYNALVSNYSVFNKEKAVAILEEASDHEIIQQNPLNTIFVHLQLAVHYFDLKKYKPANKNLARLKILDKYATLDKGFQLKISVAELIVRFELDDTDYLEHLIKQVKKEFRILLADENYLRQRNMIEIIGEMIYVERVKKDEELLQKINALIASVPTEEAYDTDLLNYNEWLLGKM